MSGCHVPTIKVSENKETDIIDWSYLLKRITTIENFIGQNYKQDYKDLLDMIGNLSMKFHKMESSLREFEKQRVNLINMRLTELEEWTRKDEDRIYERIKKLSERLDKLESKSNV